MPRRLLALNVLLVAASVALVLYIGWALTAAGPAPASAPAVTARSTPAPATPDGRAAVPPGAYGVIASRNLFHPSRSEVAGATAAGTPVDGLPRPYLYGVVLREGAPIAYLEDPVTKRVAGYRIGDTIAGGTVQAIAADRVVLSRPEGAVDVRLHDPTKPRPAPPTPDEGPAAGRPRAAPVPTPLPQPPPQFQPPPGAQAPPRVFSPGRRVLPPSLLRRLPPAANSDAPSR